MNDERDPDFEPDFERDSPYRAVVHARYYRCWICMEELSGRVKVLGHVAVHVDCLARPDEAKG